MKGEDSHRAINECMFNQERIRKVKKLGLSIAVLLGGLLVFVLGFGIGTNKQKEVQVPVKQEAVEKTDDLTEKTVNQFLIAYYTKKDLGENRNRYEPFVTSTMYNELIKEEEQPVNQAYKGYTVNQVLDKADIYINKKNESAICVVSYKNTQRVKKGNDDGAIKNQSNEEAIRLTFSKQGKHYLVDKMEPVTLTNLLSNESNSYNTNVTVDSEESLPTLTKDTTEQSDNTTTVTKKEDETNESRKE